MESKPSNGIVSMQFVFTTPSGNIPTGDMSPTCCHRCPANFIGLIVNILRCDHGCMEMLEVGDGEQLGRTFLDAVRELECSLDDLAELNKHRQGIKSTPIP